MQNRALTAVLLAILAQRLNAQGTVSYRIAYTGAAGTQLEPVEVGYLLIDNVFASVDINDRVQTHKETMWLVAHTVYTCPSVLQPRHLHCASESFFSDEKETRLQLFEK